MDHKNSKLKFKSYYTISGWMLQNLPKYDIKNLPEIAIFAIIYAYCNDNKTFTGSLQYLSYHTKGGRSTIVKSLQKMVEANILIKQPQKDSQRIFYKINQETLLKLQEENLVLDNTSLNQNQSQPEPVQNQTSSQMDMNQSSNNTELVSKQHGTSSQMDSILINNKNINKTNNRNKENIRKIIIDNAMKLPFYKTQWNFIPQGIKENDYKLSVYDSLTDWILYSKKENDVDFIKLSLKQIADIYKATSNNPDIVSHIKQCISLGKTILIPDCMRSSIQKIQKDNSSLTDKGEINKKYQALQYALKNGGKK